MKFALALYGLWVMQHHSANRVLVVMSPAGIRAARAAMGETEGLEIRSGPGRFTQYVEQKNGALDRLIARYGIQVVNLARWSALKQAFGDACRR